MPLDPDPQNSRPGAVPLSRAVAVIEVLVCSDYPTQLAIGATFGALGFSPYAAPGQLRVGYVVGLSLLDAAVLIGLILLFLRAHGEHPRDILLGRRPFSSEAVAGLPLILVAIGIGVAVLAPIQRFAPWLHTVDHNPLEALLRTPRDAWLFAVVAVVAGGVREEIQRAFLLHRFEGWLGGGVTGVIVTSVAFGAGHLLQGVDAAIATALLGAFWGVTYLRRRSAIAAMVSHSGFNLLQVLQFTLTGR